MIGVLELCRWQIVEVAVQPLGVVPGHPPERGEFDGLDGAPRALLGPVDQLRLVQAVDRFGSALS
jgi:hypothetical protein